MRMGVMEVEHREVPPHGSYDHAEILVWVEGGGFRVAASRYVSREEQLFISTCGPRGGMWNSWFWDLDRAEQVIDLLWLGAPAELRSRWGTLSIEPEDRHELHGSCRVGIRTNRGRMRPHLLSLRDRADVAAAIRFVTEELA